MGQRGALKEKEGEESAGEKGGSGRILQKLPTRERPDYLPSTENPLWRGGGGNTFLREGKNSSKPLGGARSKRGGHSTEEVYYFEGGSQKKRQWTAGKEEEGSPIRVKKGGKMLAEGEGALSLRVRAGGKHAERRGELARSIFSTKGASSGEEYYPGKPQNTGRGALEKKIFSGGERGLRRKKVPPLPIPEKKKNSRRMRDQVGTEVSRGKDTSILTWKRKKTAKGEGKSMQSPRGEESFSRSTRGKDRNQIRDAPINPRKRGKGGSQPGSREGGRKNYLRKGELAEAAPYRTTSP